MDHSGTDAANDGLDRQCDSKTRVRGGNCVEAIACTEYSKNNGVVAFFCNSEFAEEKGCTSTQRRETSRAITDQCGWYIRGQALVVNGNFGYAEEDKSFCFYMDRR